MPNQLKTGRLSYFSIKNVISECYLIMLFREEINYKNVDDFFTLI